MGVGGSYFLSQFLYQLPLMLACILGVVLALAFWKRCPGASLMTLLASAVLLVVTVVVLGLQSYLFSARVEQGWSMARYGYLAGILATVGSVVRGAAVGCIVGAVFVGRRR